MLKMSRSGVEVEEKMTRKNMTDKLQINKVTNGFSQIHPFISEISYKTT